MLFTDPHIREEQRRAEAREKALLNGSPNGMTLLDPWERAAISWESVLYNVEKYPELGTPREQKALERLLSPDAQK